MNEIIRGNKGEWSELYVLLRLLADGQLDTGDEDLNIIEDSYMPVLSIFRKLKDNGKVEYKVCTNNIELYLNDIKIKTITSIILDKYANELLEAIIKGPIGKNQNSFEIELAYPVMDDLKCDRLKAPSTDKTDILINIYDRMTSISSIVGYSIKSHIGGPPHILNASAATNFRYNIIDITDEEMEYINNINTRTKIIDRINAIGERIRFDKVINDTFSGNLMLVDSMMPEILSYMLAKSYCGGMNKISDLVNWIEDKDPIRYSRRGIYTYKIKKLLTAIALGMKPSKLWDGLDEANGGYITVKTDGEVVAFHLYNRNVFENYLLKHTKFERGKTGRHKYASIYKTDDKYYINLNFAVRFL